MPKAAAAAVTGAPANGEPHDTIYDIKATLHRLPLLLTKNESEKYNNIIFCASSEGEGRKGERLRKAYCASSITP